MSSAKKLVSLVIPVYNEEANISSLYEAVLPIMNGLSDRYDFEMVFTDNHSTDETFNKLNQLYLQDPRIRVFRFSKNFGYQKSILTGYLKARGDALIQLDCDLQDPPSLIPEFLKHWELGHAVVYGIRQSRQENRLMNYTRKIFYRLVNGLSEDDLPVDAGDFRLIDRKIVEVLRQVEDSRPYLRGLIASVGFRQKGIPYSRNARERGTSHFLFKDLMGLAIDGILNHSVAPLRFATFFGAAVSFVTFIGIVIYIIGKIVFQFEWPAGFTTLAILSLAGISLNALFLGIIGEYLGRIYVQVKKKPLVIIETQLDHSASLEKK